MSNRGKKEGLLVCGLVALGAVVSHYGIPEVENALDRGQVRRPRDARHTMHPEIAEAKMRHIYAVMDAYRREHGRLPGFPALLGDAKGRGGLLRPGEDWLDDAPYAEVPNKPYQAFQYACYAPRPDGTPKPAFPKPGERDVWLKTTTYARPNNRDFRNGRTGMDPAGFVLALWSDGVIERIPYERVQMAWKGMSATDELPGQAGLPKGSLGFGPYASTPSAKRVDRALRVGPAR